MPRCASTLCLALAVPLAAQDPAGWLDPSPHRVEFVTVEKEVRLEVLDWGGSGTPLVLLAGGGNTAHVFDDFAPKLTAGHHVLAITRRGFGASGFSLPANVLQRLRDDVLAVMDAQKLVRPVLIGHSIAGAELSSIASRHPERIAGLVYIEAGYPYAFDNGKGPSMQEFLQLAGPQAPDPGASALADFPSLQRWDEHVYGFRMPEAEFRQTWDSGPGDTPVRPRAFPGSQLLMAVISATTRPKEIPVPALVLFAVPHVPENWMKAPAVQDAARAYFRKIDALSRRQADALEAAVPTAHVVRRRGMHYLFLSNGPEVLRQIQAFLATLK